MSSTSRGHWVKGKKILKIFEFKKTRQKPAKEAAKRPASLKELQEYLTGIDYCLHVTTIYHIIHMSGLWGSMAKKKHFLTKIIQAQLYHSTTMCQNLNCNLITRGIIIP